ncbi:hypothetical protein [Pannonibacter phragmitetus]|uniref:hypothetical protein n=1 Tax=Pannonibacter phragmitetus TaxID=121719 RepID=UPI001AD918B3|nr:hypothetical protein [Pannonibacter phragmitetus]
MELCYQFVLRKFRTHLDPLSMPAPGITREVCKISFCRADSDNLVIRDILASGVIILKKSKERRPARLHQMQEKKIMVTHQDIRRI